LAAFPDGSVNQAAAVSRLAVMSRVEPMHKLKLVELLRAQVGRGGVRVGAGMGGGGVPAVKGELWVMEEGEE
jgi:hypothetical protein